MRSRVLRCSCDHDYQDRVYGPGLRLHNKLAAEPGQKHKAREYRCTVCGREK